ncbi:hypothetical protein ACOJR9_02855 [Alteromonas sp. A081]|uniref:hypothetical protein n=1 Tax=Alteromonas sp. A081 TaxID=3410269 RepID=UPI003B97E291
MEGLNKQISTLLITAALVVGGVSLGLNYVLTQFQEIQENFETELPFWLSWVFPTFDYWFVITGALIVLFVFSLKPSIKRSLTFNRAAVKAALLGYACSVLFVVFSVLAIYWPVVQHA